MCRRLRLVGTGMMFQLLPDGLTSVLQKWLNISANSTSDSSNRSGAVLSLNSADGLSFFSLPLLRPDDFSALISSFGYREAFDTMRASTDFSVAGEKLVVVLNGVGLKLGFRCFVFIFYHDDLLRAFCSLEMTPKSFL